jgi:hypothetical protein
VFAGPKSWPAAVIGNARTGCSPAQFARRTCRENEHFHHAPTATHRIARPRGQRCSRCRHAAPLAPHPVPLPASGERERSFDATLSFQRKGKGHRPSSSPLRERERSSDATQICGKNARRSPPALPLPACGEREGVRGRYCKRCKRRIAAQGACVFCCSARILVRSRSAVPMSYGALPSRYTARH